MTIRLDELMASLHAYEMNQKMDGKEEGMVLKVEAKIQRVLQQAELQ